MNDPSKAKVFGNSKKKSVGLAQLSISILDEELCCSFQSRDIVAKDLNFVNTILVEGEALAHVYP